MINKINWKAPATIVFLVLLLITIVSFCLMRVWDGFAIIGSACFVCISFMATFKSCLNYQIFKQRLADQKLSDAYLYAEEIGDEEAIKDFAYDKKTNRKIRYEKFNRLIVPWSCVAILVCAVFLFLICTKII